MERGRETLSERRGVARMMYCMWVYLISVVCDVKQAWWEVRRRSKVLLYLLIARGPQVAEDPQARQWTGLNIQRQSSCASILAEDSQGEKKKKKLFLSSLTFNVTCERLQQISSWMIRLVGNKNTTCQNASMFYYILIDSVVALFVCM